ncbi:DUF6644 family protein [Sphingomonas bacterium]|nr:DUF6644 family protein [Sphingomonas bacterium]
MFPAIETLHVLALTLVIGTIAMLDLRLVGASSRNLRVMQLSNETLPWTWTAFVVAAITGTAMFASHATKYYANVPFRIKMVLLVLAGMNMAVFHFGAWKAVHVWDAVLPTPRAARIAGGLSLVFWIGVVFAGRWVGFVD